MAASGHGDWRPSSYSLELCQRLAEDLSVDCITRLRQIAAELRRNGDVRADVEDGAVLATLSTVVTDVFAKSLDVDLARFSTSERMEVCESGAGSTLDPHRMSTCDSSPPPPMKGGSRLRRSLTKRIPSFVRRRGEKKSAKKEAVLRQLIDVEGSSMQWAKCRIVLRREPGGHMISFFSPPKVS